MAKNKTLSKESALAILDKVALFDDMNRKDKQLLAQFHWYFVAYKTGDYLTDEDSLDKRFFILLSGGVNVLKGTSQQLITQLSPGEIIGEISFLTNEPRTASVIANTDSTALVIDQELLDELPIETREKLKDQLILKMALRLNRMNNRFALSQT
ncbi:cyclic nucleotide-binding domain-containing protein [Neptuniibacter sp. PT8_73]|uniref:cyclic nucleotide-binding domain-containing protein n=1 Tax=unclassified Neptuniibacter TaxID=2630693 RepID=UPI0039F707D6